MLPLLPEDRPEFFPPRTSRSIRMRRLSYLFRNDLMLGFRKHGRTLLRCVEVRLDSFVHRAAMVNGGLGHVASPSNQTTSDEVVRPARKIPVADRWLEANSNAIKSELPIRRRERRHNFSSTPAGALVRGYGIVHRHIQNALDQLVGDVLHELVREACLPQGPGSSLVNWFSPTLNVESYSARSSR